MHAKIVVLFVGLATIRCLLGDSVHGFPVCKLQISIDHMFFSQELLWRITKKQPSCAGDITHESTVRDVLEHFQGGKNMITERGELSEGAPRRFRRGGNI